MFRGEGAAAARAGARGGLESPTGERAWGRWCGCRGARAGREGEGDMIGVVVLRVRVMVVSSVTVEMMESSSDMDPGPLVEMVLVCVVRMVVYRV